MNEPAAILLRDLQFRYDPHAPMVLQGLDLTVHSRTVTAILGPNGCGKTTLLHILLGRLQPLAGDVLVAGQSLRSISRQSMSRLVGLVPQEEDYPFEVAVLDYVVLGRAPYLGWLDLPKPDDYTLAESAIRQAGIAHLQWRALPSLSGGERQLVRVARALAQHAHILLMDEPTNHLDLSNQGRVLRMMKELAGQGTTVIFTTHDATAAALVADNVILLREGQIVDAGPLGQVFTDDNLSTVYGTRVRVRSVEDRLVVLAD